MREHPLVLLVDDEDVFLEIASTKLARAGYETALAKGAEDGISKARDLLPDIVVSDIYMPPGPNGWELALELRRSDRTRDIKLVFFTSLQDPWLELKKNKKEILSEIGPIHFLSKIDDVDILPQRVGDLLNK